MADRQNRTRLRTRSHSEETMVNGTQRGQVEPRHIFGFIILIVIAPALITAAVDIQSSLASTPAFTWFSASVIAILIVAALVAAALGLE